MRFEGSIALVTGASRGLGRAAARALGAEGAHVIAVARTVGGLEELDDAVKAAGGATTLVPLDITDDQGLERLGAAIHQRWGRVDLWLHTAAHAPTLTPMHHATEKDIDTTLAVNVRAFQRLVRVVDPLLRPAPAPRALVAADRRTHGKPFFGIYAASKAAQSAIAASWAAEAARHIDVREIEPPAMPTALRARFYPGEDRSRLTTCEDAATRLVETLAAETLPEGALAL